MDTTGDTKIKSKSTQSTDEPISLVVVAQDGTEVHFKIKSSASLQKMFNAYCTRQGISESSVKFLFDGNAWIHQKQQWICIWKTEISSMQC